ncbi:hypothetical protein NESM_000261300 [Novymonas esmeraldas]|uniref:Uncharacterized protein n=1 Tax=Novymonas esmeraldas TaxID=1808958 RepID=A0AAW0F8T8_9TRYP
MPHGAHPVESVRLRGPPSTQWSSNEPIDDHEAASVAFPLALSEVTTTEYSPDEQRTASTQPTNLLCEDQGNLERLAMAVDMQGRVQRQASGLTRGSHRGDGDGDTATAALLAKVQLHLYTIPQALPPLSSPELRLIGRCVSFRATRRVEGTVVTRYYSGVVGLVTVQSVLLFHAHLFASADFKAYRRHHRRLYRRVRRLEHERAEQRQGSANVRLVPYGKEGAVGVDARDRLGVAVDPTLACELHIEHGGLSPSDAVRVVPPTAFPGRHQRRLTGAEFERVTVGPFAFLAVQRRSIEDVRFHLDPTSAAGPLFQKPERAAQDEQRLRLLVRRYLVYTSVGDNAAHVPLVRFVEAHGGFVLQPGADNAASTLRPTASRLGEMAAEELRVLLQLHTALTDERRRRRATQSAMDTMDEVEQQQRRRQRQAEQQLELQDSLFKHTGVAYFTRIPQLTFYGGLFGCFVVLVSVVFVSISHGVMAADALSRSYMRRLLPYDIVAVVVWMLCFVFIAYNATQLCFPLLDRPVCLFSRVAATCLVIAAAVMIVVITGVHLREDALRSVMVNGVSTAELCAYYRTHVCSGFRQPCAASDSTAASDPLCRCDELASSYSDVPCHTHFFPSVMSLSVPTMVLACLALVVAVYTAALLPLLKPRVNALSRHHLHALW